MFAQAIDARLDDGSSTRRIDLLVLALAFPLGFAVSPFHVFSIDSGMVSVCDIGLFLYIALVLLRAMTGVRRMYLRMDLPMAALFCLMVAGILSGIPPLMSGNIEYMRQCMKSLTHFSYMWFFAVCCSATVVRLESLITLFRTFVAFAIPINIFGMYQVPARAFSWPLAWIEYSGPASKQTNQLSLEFGGFFRATSIFSEPSAFALFTMMTAIMLLVPYFLYDVRIIKNRFVFYTALYSSFIAMFLTFSLTIVVLFSAFVLVLTLFARSSASKKIMTMVAVMTVVFGLTNKAISSYADADLFDLYFRRIVSTAGGGDKVEGIVGESFDTRADAQRTAISVWKQSPVFGIGFGCIGYARDTDALLGVHVLQMYLTSLATAGVLGGLAIVIYMAGICAGTVRMLYVRLRRMERGSAASTEDVVLAIVTFLGLNQAVHGLSSDNLILQYHWVVMGLVSLVYYHPTLRSSWNESPLLRVLRFGAPQPIVMAAAPQTHLYDTMTSERKSTI